MPQWRTVLRRIVGGDADMSSDEKAAILGVPAPGRRDLFKMGGAAILGAAVLAACGSDAKDTASSTAGATGSTSATAASTAETMDTGTMGSGTVGSGATTGGGDGMDLTLAKTAASLEKLAVDVYGSAAALLTTPAVVSAATLFAGHHQMHLDALNGVITGAGAAAVTEQNAAVFNALVKPSLDKATTETDALMIALALEEAAAQTYAFAGGALSTPALRSTIMTIGGVEARHATVLRMVALAQTPLDVFPGKRAFFPGANPLAGIDGALIS
jgi:rubrerythrin